MRITLHGHRPGRRAAQDASSTAARPPDQTQSPAVIQAGAREETVTSVHLGFVKLKIHRQTARQSALLAQVPRPHAGTSGSVNDVAALGTSAVRPDALLAAMKDAPPAPQLALTDPDGLAALSALLPLAPTGLPPMRSGRRAQSQRAEALDPQGPASLAALSAQLPLPPSTRPQAAKSRRLERQPVQVLERSAPGRAEATELNALLAQSVATPADTEMDRPAHGALRPSVSPSQLADPYQLDRFVQAQAHTYQAAISEMRRGAKETHWMWFVFPQLGALGQSSLAKRYGLENLQEARAYWAHPVLGPRLRESIRTMLQTSGASAASILGRADAMKFQSCLTLFAKVDPSNRDIQLALARFYKGRPDELTQALVLS